MIESLMFMKDLIPAEMLIPFLILLAGLYYKYAHTSYVEHFDELKNKAGCLKDIKNGIDNLDKKLSLIKSLDDRSKQHYEFCHTAHENSKADVKTIRDLLETLEKHIDNVVSRLEYVKDKNKDDQLELNKLLYDIKHEISDLRVKFEPLLYISKGIK